MSRNAGTLKAMSSGNFSERWKGQGTLALSRNAGKVQGTLAMSRNAGKAKERWQCLENVG